MTNGVRTNAPHLVVGFGVMFLGILLVLDRLHVVEAGRILQFWPVWLVLLGGSMMLQAIRGGPEAGAGSHRGNVPVGGIIWLVLLGLLFSHAFERRSAAARTDDRERPSLFALMSSDQRVTHGERFHGAEMTAIMGGTELDLRQSTLGPGEEAVIDVFAVMGGAIVRVPQGWVLDVRSTSVMGGVKDERRRAASLPPAGQADRDAPSAAAVVEREDKSMPPGSDPPRLVLRGFVMMGGLIIKS